MKKFVTMLLILVMSFVTACTYQQPVEEESKTLPVPAPQEDVIVEEDIVENIHNIPVMASIVGEYDLWTISLVDRHISVQMGSIEFTELLVIEDDWYIGDTHWKYMVDTSDVEHGLTAFLVHADIAEAFLMKVAEVYHLPMDEMELFIADSREEIEDQVCIFFAIAI